eukprot:TRINITY_DN28795_c0_g1_i1.p1 TRINITY_DN28795_c0_g1~~TRINITY_DN28795_c0_g1_i1.p1  ORF type:complete len:366 (+),score=63.89 TRINITY_DN28795_c0_g1_i1:23-1099(+)
MAEPSELAASLGALLLRLALSGTGIADRPAESLACAGTEPSPPAQGGLAKRQSIDASDEEARSIPRPLPRPVAALAARLPSAQTSSAAHVMPSLAADSGTIVTGADAQDVLAQADASLLDADDQLLASADAIELRVAWPDKEQDIYLKMHQFAEVSDLKRSVCKALDGLPMQCLRLLFEGQCLQPEELLLSDFGIQQGSEVTISVVPLQVTRHIYSWQTNWGFKGLRGRCMNMFERTDIVCLNPMSTLESQLKDLLPLGIEFRRQDLFPFCNLAGLLWQCEDQNHDAYLYWRAQRCPPSAWEYIQKKFWDRESESVAMQLDLSRPVKEMFGEGRTELIVLDSVPAGMPPVIHHTRRKD